MKKIILVLTVLGTVLFGGDYEDAMLAAMQEDYKKAAELFQKESDKGNPAAQTNLALFYENGQGVEQNNKKAVELYKQAADQGYTLAQNNLGNMYIQGKGVAKDKRNAYLYWSKAAKGGNQNAQYNLDSLCRKSPSVCNNSIVDKQTNNYAKYMSVNSIGQDILDLNGVDIGTQISVWNESKLKKEFLDVFPNFTSMKDFAKERIKGESLTAKLLEHINNIEKKFFDGTINHVVAKEELGLLK